MNEQIWVGLSAARMTIHNWFRNTALTSGLLLMASACPTWGQSYTAVDLNPPGFDYSEAYGISGGQQVGYGYTSNNPHALLWSGTANSIVDLGLDSVAVGVSGGQQVGYNYVWSGGQFNRQAVLWSGTAASAVSLHPIAADLQPQFTESLTLGVSGGQQVGWAYGPSTGNAGHAYLWSGTAASAMDLNPAGFTYSFAIGVSSGQQVGYGLGPSITTNQWHALLWSGTAASAVDLNPAGFMSSIARAISDGQQVGQGWEIGSPQNQHALLWSGTAASAVDLNPLGFDYSQAQSISGGQEVGWGYGPSSGDKTNALLWSGSAASAVDLQNFLPAIFTSSAAYGIDANGNIVGSAMDGNGVAHAILWTPVSVPEPCTFTLLAIGFVLVILTCPL